MIMRSKKDVVLPGIRVSSEFAERWGAAITKLELATPDYSRQLMLDIIRIAESGERVAYPGRVLTERQQRILSYPRVSFDHHNVAL
jgi:hypothetical protein